MRQLSAEEIQPLASRQGVRKTAVENFLITMGTSREKCKAEEKNRGLMSRCRACQKQLKDNRIVVTQFTKDFLTGKITTKRYYFCDWDHLRKWLEWGDESCKNTHWRQGNNGTHSL